MLMYITKAKELNFDSIGDENVPRDDGVKIK